MATPDSYVENLSATAASTTSRTFANDSLTVAPSKTASLQLAFGTGSGQVNDGGQTIVAPAAASGTATLQFGTSVPGIYDESIAFTLIKSLLISNLSTTASASISGALWNTICGTSATTTSIKPGCFVAVNTTAGWAAADLVVTNNHASIVGSVLAKYSGVE